jgi:hypothetical protein
MSMMSWANVKALTLNRKRSSCCLRSTISQDSQKTAVSFFDRPSIFSMQGFGKKTTTASFFDRPSIFSMQGFGKKSVDKEIHRLKTNYEEETLYEDVKVSVNVSRRSKADRFSAEDVLFKIHFSNLETNPSLISV